MDEPHSIRAPRGANAPNTAKTVQTQPARATAAGAQPQKSGEADSYNEHFPVGEAPAPSAPTSGMVKQPELATVLRASRSELDQLLAETQHLHERSWRVIHTLLEDSQLRASQAVDACLVRFEQALQERVSNEMAMTLQNLDIEADARLAARLDQALAAARQRQADIEQDLAVAVADNRKQVDQIRIGASDELRQHKQGLLENLRKEAQKELGELAKSADQISSSIGQLSNNLTAQIQQHIEEAVQVFQSRIEQVWQEAAGRAEKQITETAHTCVADLAKQAREVVDREMSEFLSRALRRFDRSSDVQSPNRDT